MLQHLCAPFVATPLSSPLATDLREYNTFDCVRIP